MDSDTDREDSSSESPHVSRIDVVLSDLSDAIKFHDDDYSDDVQSIRSSTSSRLSNDIVKENDEETETTIFQSRVEVSMQRTSESSNSEASHIRISDPDLRYDPPSRKSTDSEIEYDPLSRKSTASDVDYDPPLRKLTDPDLEYDPPSRKSTESDSDSAKKSRISRSQEELRHPSSRDTSDSEDDNDFQEHPQKVQESSYNIPPSKAKLNTDFNRNLQSGLLKQQERLTSKDSTHSGVRPTSLMTMDGQSEKRNVEKMSVSYPGVFMRQSVAKVTSPTSPPGPSGAFEAVNDGELPSPTHQSGASEPMSLKEEIADREEEKVRDGSSTGSLDDLDLISGEEHKALSHEASKQKVQLRQRGSLAKRRKPTRTSIRNMERGSGSIGSPDNKDAGKKLMNGHVSPDNDVHDSVFHESTRTETNIEMSTASQGTMLKSGRSIHGVKTAIVSSEVIESSRHKLRSVIKRTSSSSSDTETNTPPVEAERPRTPPWLVEARSRRISRPPRGEIEKLQQEKKPETPAWMKDALAKKMRSANRFQSTDSTEESPPEDSQSTSHSSAPWMQEATLRKTARLQSLVVNQKEVSDNVNNMIADSHKTDVEEPREISLTITKHKEYSAPVQKESVQRREPVQAVTVEEENVFSPPSSTDKEEEKRKKRMIRVSREAIKKAPLTLDEILSTNVTPEPDHGEPAWKTEVVLRRKSKSYIVPQKPEQPFRLGEVPQWKKDLLEKRQSRVEPEAPPHGEHQRHASTGALLTQWQQELKIPTPKRKSVTVTIQPVMVTTESSEVEAAQSSPEDEPEWAQLVARRRERLVSSGLIKVDDVQQSSKDPE